MIPFNLERAKLGLPMRTRAGNKAKLIAHLDGGQAATIVAEIDGHSLENYYLNGRHNIYHDTEFDLFMEY